MANKRVKEYSNLSKGFHWLISFLVIPMLVFGFLLEDIPSSFKSTAFTLHKSVGITILFLMIFRLINILIAGKPPLPISVRLWEKVLSRFIQYGFYLLLLMMPLSGWILSMAAGWTPHYFGLFDAPLPGIEKNKALAEFMENAHEVIAWIIIGFLTLHVLGALKHHFINKDNVLKRMLLGKSSQGVSHNG